MLTDSTSPVRAFRVNSLRENIKRIVGGGKIALDLGCGVGGNLEMLTQKYCNVVGLDISVNALKDARRHFKKVNMALATAEHLPFSDHTFDFVLATEVIEHLIAPEEMLSEIHRVVSPKGQVVITTPNHLELQRIVYNCIAWVLSKGGLHRDRSQILLRNVYGKLMGHRDLVHKNEDCVDEHLHNFTPHALNKLLKKQGFEVTYFGGCGILPPFGYLFNKFPNTIKFLERFEEFIIKTPLKYLFTSFLIVQLTRGEEND
jgi:ubiquinone/menaquinone biosynthesis C-methylase UbiE